MNRMFPNCLRGAAALFLILAIPICLHARRDEFAKIEIAEEGIYIITYEELNDLGLDLQELDPSRINVYNKGRTVPIYIHGTEDLHFNIGDYIEFFATPNKGEYSTRDPHAPNNIYFLEFDDDAHPKRFEEVSGEDISMVKDADFVKKKVFKNRKRFEKNTPVEKRLHTKPGHEQSDHSFWAWVDSSRRPFKNLFSVPNLALEGEVELQVQCFGNSSYNFSPDHHVVVVINNRDVAEAEADGYGRFMIKAKFENNNYVPLEPLTNKIELIATGDAITYNQPNHDLVLLDYIDITYQKKFPDGNTMQNKLHLEKNRDVDLDLNILETREAGFKPWYLLDSDDKPFEFRFNIERLDRSEPVTLAFGLIGITDLAWSPDHHLIFKLNNAVIDEMYFDGKKEYIHTIDVKGDLFKQAGNFLEIFAPGDASINPDQSKTSTFKERRKRKAAEFKDYVLVDWFELFYDRNNRALGNVIDCYSVRNTRTRLSLVELRGFTSGNIDVYDVTSNRKIKPYVSQIQSEKKTEYSVHFFEEFDQETRYIVLTHDEKKKPVSLVKRSLANLKNPDNAAELIILTPDKFYADALRLAEWKNSLNIPTVTVKINDVYDEFNFGLAHPKAIREFLRYAYREWKTPPKYAILVGDTLWDIANASERGIVNYMPTHQMRYPNLRAFAYDSWFGCVDDDDLIPEIAIGRFPVQNVDQMMTIVDKIIRYESFVGVGDWRRRMHFLSSGLTADLEECEYIANKLLSPIFNVEKEYNPTENVLGDYEGTLLLYFFGKGDEDNWLDTELFTKDNLSQLGNTGSRYPLVIASSDYSAVFDTNSVKPSLGESWLLVPKRGCVTFIGQTAAVDPNYQYAFTREFTRSLLRSNTKIVGDAFLEALGQFSGTHHLFSTTILGDPSLKVTFPDLKIAMKIEDTYTIGKPYSLEGSIGQLLDGSAKFYLYTGDGEEIFFQNVPIKKGKFSVKMVIPLTANDGEECFWKCYAWSSSQKKIGFLKRKQEYETYVDGLAWGTFMPTFPRF